jgi:prevent-host-death family protein
MLKNLETIRVITIREARENLTGLVREVSEDHVVIGIAALGIGNAVLMPAADYKSIKEALRQIQPEST